jgi:hypothetical protein
MKTRDDYERALQAVREVVHRLDPYDLLGGCFCPPDEFDNEIALVVAQIRRIRSRTDAAHVLLRVFSAAFEPERFRPVDCATVGTELYEALAAEGLLQG